MAAALNFHPSTSIKDGAGFFPLSDTPLLINTMSADNKSLPPMQYSRLGNTGLRVSLIDCRYNA
jgi:hypothetical protein